ADQSSPQLLGVVGAGVADRVSLVVAGVADGVGGLLVIRLHGVGRVFDVRFHHVGSVVGVGFDIIRRLLICALVARGESAESKSDGDRAGQFHHSIPCCGGQSVRAARSFPEPQYAQWPFSVPALQQL